MQEAVEQEAVKALGMALSSVLLHMLESSRSWEMNWQKIDLSNGFWCMIMEAR